MKKSVLVSAVAVSVIFMGAGCKTAMPVEQPSVMPASVSTTTEMENVNNMEHTTSSTSATETTTQTSTTLNIKAAVETPTVMVSNVKSFSITAKNWDFVPNTITVNKGDKVKLSLTSVDVEHGFKLPDFGVKVDLAPGKTEVVEFVADKVGTFSFSCSVFCGSGHREMKGTLIVK